MDIRLENCVAIVTGAGSGIGFACAEALAKHGAKVAMIGRNPDKIKKAADMLKAQGKVFPYVLDVADIEAIPAVIEKIRNDLGEISCLVQSAGIMAGGPAVNLKEDEWDRVMNTNAKGLFFVMQSVVKQSMMPRGYGSIVNISSMAGIRGMVPPMCSAHYSASKGAVAALSLQGAVEWGEYGIRVNAIAPGGTLTMGVGAAADSAIEGPPDSPNVGYIPTGKLNDPYQVANLAVFLCSNLSGNTTGQIMVIDGGSSAVGY